MPQIPKLDEKSFTIHHKLYQILVWQTKVLHTVNMYYVKSQKHKKNFKIASENRGRSSEKLNFLIKIMERESMEQNVWSAEEKTVNQKFYMQ